MKIQCMFSFPYVVLILRTIKNMVLRLPCKYLRGSKCVVEITATSECFFSFNLLEKSLQIKLDNFEKLVYEEIMCVIYCFCVIFYICFTSLLGFKS